MTSSPGEALVLFSLPTVVEVAREAFLGLGCARDAVRRCNDVEVRCLGFDICGKNLKGTGHYLSYGFMHRIVAKEEF
jgi:hypothetical protein